MFRSNSSIARWLEPLSGAVWIGFWVWTVLTAVVWLGRIGDGEMIAWTDRHFPSPEAGVVGHATSLQAALSVLLGVMDPVWVVLAAVNCYLSANSEVGLATARRWTGWVVVSAFTMAVLTSMTGWPLGALRYTGRLGPRLGPVPLGFPLLWCILILGGREAVRWVWPRASHTQVTLGTGLLVLLTNMSLDPIAWKMRVWWLWMSGGPGPVSYAAWGVLAMALTYFCRSGGARVRDVRAGRGAAVFLALNALCLLSHVGR